MKILKSLKAVACSGIVALGLSTAGHALELSDLKKPGVAEAFVDGLVLPLMREKNSPSGVVSIMKDGELIFAKGYGFQDIEKQIKTDAATTLFRPGSISKLFTWVAVMQMVEQGKLDLDADVNKYLKTFQLEDTYPGQPITMRHIMTHTAGFEDGGLGYFVVEDFEDIKP
ncbi:MAG: beta-lactamase family protein, partial [Kordiimonadaceae bacterium]|nr:beta-lactamase family protein [Kordiimonadaceae bacterium]